MEKLTIWYSVHNGGDGSAYPVLMESERQVQIDQQNQDEGWGEPCYGSIVVTSATAMSVTSHVITIAEQLKEMEDELKEPYVQEYIKQGMYKGYWMRLERHIAALKELQDA